MNFRLTYRGKLKAKNSSTISDIQQVRRHFHEQLKILWSQPPLSTCSEYINPTRVVSEGNIFLIKTVKEFHFAPLVSSAKGWHAVADIKILFLRPGEPGKLVGHDGDLDNRVKVLLDSLRVPTDTEIPKDDSPGELETPFYCLLQDDALITSLSVTTDRLLNHVDRGYRGYVELVIEVGVRALRRTMGNDPIW